MSTRKRSAVLLILLTVFLPGCGVNIQIFVNTAIDKILTDLAAAFIESLNGSETPPPTTTTTTTSNTTTIGPDGTTTEMFDSIMTEIVE